MKKVSEVYSIICCSLFCILLVVISVLLVFGAGNEGTYNCKKCGSQLTRLEKPVDAEGTQYFCKECFSYWNISGLKVEYKDFEWNN